MLQQAKDYAKNTAEELRGSAAQFSADARKYLAQHTPLPIKGGASGHEYEVLNMFRSNKATGWAPPVWNYIRRYSWRDFWMDLNCGITIGLIVIPQALSYASVVGIPVYYGLYAAFLAKMPYVLFGTSPHVQIGPTAVVSLIVNSLVLQVVPGGYPKTLTPTSKTLAGLSPTQVEAAIEANLVTQNFVLQNVWLLSFFTGLFIFAVGLFRVGFIVNFMSRTVLSGFISACAFIVASTQIRNFFGLTTKTNDQVWIQVMLYFEEFHNQVDYTTTWLSIVWLAILMTFEYISNKFARLKLLKSFGPFIVLIMGTLVSAQQRLVHNYGIKEVGAIPIGMPAAKNPFTSPSGCLVPIVNVTSTNPQGVCTFPAVLDYNLILSQAIIGALIGYLEQIAIGTSTSLRFDYRVDPNMEAISMGLACILCGFFQGFSVNGSLSRTVVAANVGGRTPLSSIYVFIIIIIVINTLTKPVKDVPYFALAAIVIFAAKNLVDYQLPIKLWKTAKLEFLLWFITFVLTMMIGIELGIGIAVLLSLIRILAESAFPKITVLGYLPTDDHTFKSIEKVPTAKIIPHVHILRIDSPIHFANISFIKQQIHTMLLKYNSIDAVKTAEILPVFAWFKKTNEPVENVIDRKMVEMAYVNEDGTANNNNNNNSYADNPIKYHQQHRIKFLILDFSPVTSIDSGGVEGLVEMYNDCKRNRVALLFTNVSDVVYATLEINDVTTNLLFKDHHAFGNNYDALQVCRNRLDSNEITPGAIKPSEYNNDNGNGSSSAPLPPPPADV